MNNEFIIYAVAFIGMVAAIISKGKTLKSDTEAANEFFSWSKFLLDSVWLIVVSLAIYAGIVTGANIGNLDLGVDLTSIGAALLTGSGIPTAADKWVLAIGGGNNKARKKLRAKVDVKTDRADYGFTGKTL